MLLLVILFALPNQYSDGGSPSTSAESKSVQSSTDGLGLWRVTGDSVVVVPDCVAGHGVKFAGGSVLGWVIGDSSLQQSHMFPYHSSEIFMVLCWHLFDKMHDR
jgi:hypothetical protein